MKPQDNSKIYIPLIIAVSLVAGMWIGRIFTNSQSGGSMFSDKLSQIMRLIEDKYVDEVNSDSIIEKSLPDIIAQLDPHSSYISAKDLKASDEEINGAFSGVGVQFAIMNDTISIIEVISGGPSEKVGVLAGDRIVSVNGENVAGISITNEKVMSLLKGEKGTKVTLGIKRSSSATPLTFEVTRGEIPVNSIDAAYIISPQIGFIKVTKFSRKTYEEFLSALNDLKQKGATKYIIDLRGNGGGLMGSAIMMANEFLPAGSTIVSTRHRGIENGNHRSDGTGSFQDTEVTVLIDEFSASASEIFAGAIQDNDRGLIIGRRSFGKGLVQEQISLPDTSAIRLTVSRYHTPSGRCIQKDYKMGDKNYNYEVYDRFTHGESFNVDSIKFNKDLMFTTIGGRKVYGGGGIMPDVFVPNDTAQITKYYVAVANAGLFQKFAFEYSDKNRAKLKSCKTTAQVLKTLPNDDELLSLFVEYGKRKKIPAQWYYINESRDLILTIIKSLIARDAIGMSAYYEVFNGYDVTVKNAISHIQKGDSKTPIKISITK